MYPFIRLPLYVLLLVSLISFPGMAASSRPAAYSSAVDRGSAFHPPAREFSFHPVSNESSSLPSAEMESEILRLVNLHRHSMGLAPVQMNTLESTVARLHSQNMASGKTPFGHDGFHDRAAYLNKKMGPITLVAENVASGQMSAPVSHPEFCPAAEWA